MHLLRASETTIFQSTLLVRGATTVCRKQSQPEPISIHAPRERSDNEDLTAKNASLKISIHAPRERSDEDIRFILRSDIISIHAPRERSDRCHIAV